MNINFNPRFCAVDNQYNKRNVNFGNLGALKSDTVHFSKNYKPQYPKNVQGGIEFGREILENINQGRADLDTIGKIVHSKIPDIEVLSTEELKYRNPQWMLYEAMYQSHLTDDFGLKDKTLFFKVRDIKDDNEKLLATTGAAHEFTHALQEINNTEMLEFLKTVSKNDPVAAKVLMSAGEAVFVYFDNELQSYACYQGILKGKPTAEDFERYGQFVPREAAVNRKDIFNSLNLKDEKEFEKLIDKCFDKQMEQLELCIDRDLTPEFANKLPHRNNPQKLKKILMTYCAIKARQEFEAYSTEAALAKEMLGVEDMSTDIFPIYYKMLENSLRK